MTRAVRGVRSSAALCAVLAAMVVTEAGAAFPASAQGSPGPFFRESDAVFLGGALAAAALTSLFDGRLATQLGATGGHNRAYHELATVGASVGGVGPIALSAGMFVAGHIAHRSKLASLGTWGAEAVLISGSATLLLKGVAGRERPFAAAGDVDNYVFGRGFRSAAFASFPSGHTSAAFAVATVLARGTADQSPRTHLVVSGFAYGAATLIGVSRLYANQHWPSDVVVGAAIGITSGIAVVRHAHGAPQDAPETTTAKTPVSALAYLASHTSVAPAPHGGLTFAFSAR